MKQIQLYTNRASVFPLTFEPRCQCMLVMWHISITSKIILCEFRIFVITYDKKVNQYPIENLIKATFDGINQNMTETEYWVSWKFVYNLIAITMLLIILVCTIMLAKYIWSLGVRTIRGKFDQFTDTLFRLSSHSRDREYIRIQINSIDRFINHSTTHRQYMI